MEINKRENIGWIDLLRVTACFLVVFAHCCDPFVARFDTDRPTFLQGCALGSAVRCCVPLFVMMTGVLLFPVRNGMSEFYKKRIGRIVVPLIFWSVMLPVLYFIYLNYITTTDNPTIDMSAFTLEKTITKIWTFIFNFNYDTTPLWYLYMLVGLYFIIPIFHAWLERATRKDIKLFLSIWGISLFLPYIKYPGSVRLECIRFILLCFRIYRLPDTGPLSGKIPVAMELEKNPGYRYPYVYGRVCHHFRRLPHHAGIFSGKLRLSGNSMAFRRHQCIYDDISCFCLHTEAQNTFFACSFKSGIHDLRHLSVSFRLRANGI